MADELKGEWKLLKIWECRRCKALIRFGRNISDHKCNIDENELLVQNKTIDEQKRIIEYQIRTIEDQNKVSDEKDKYIEKQKKEIEDQNKLSEEKVKYIENQKEEIEQQLKLSEDTCKEKDDIIKEKDKTIEEHKNIINIQKVSIDNRDRSIEDQKRTIESNRKAIDNLTVKAVSRDKVIAEQTRVIDQNKLIAAQSKIAEQKVITENEEDIDQQIKLTNSKMLLSEENNIKEDLYIEEEVGERYEIEEKKVIDIPKINIGDDGEKIDVDIWKSNYPIKDSKDIGYRGDIEVEIFEKGKGKKRLIIKNGKVIKKPDDIEIIGEYISDGFIVKGIYKAQN